MKSNKGVTLTSVTIYIIATKFNSYFTDEINIDKNEVSDCGVDETGMPYISFYVSQNQYSYKNNAIYRNKSKIVSNVDSCEFNYDTSTKIITVNMTINGRDFNTQYTVIK